MKSLNATIFQYLLLGNDLSGANNYDPQCRGSAEQTKHDPPLLYDVNIDPGERFPIDNNTEFYSWAIDK